MTDDRVHIVSSLFFLNRYAFSCTCDYARCLMWVARVCLAIVRVKGVYCVLYVVCHLTGLASRVAWGVDPNHTTIAIIVHTTLFLTRRIHHIVDQHSSLAIQSSSLVQSA